MNLDKISEHYEHAKEKHPYFCEWLTPPTWSEPMVKEDLAFMRKHLKKQDRMDNVHWDSVLQCEILEIIDAIYHRGNEAAVEECYDAIAVLLRVIDVLEGRQKLGRPDVGTK